MKYPSARELAAFERSLPTDLPKGAGRKAIKYRSISLATTDNAIRKRRRRYGFAQISSKSARRKQIA
jgi:hypothetical protein